VYLSVAALLLHPCCGLTQQVQRPVAHLCKARQQVAGVAAAAKGTTNTTADSGGW
jgi:hypothetical protein